MPEIIWLFTFYESEKVHRLYPPFLYGVIVRGGWWVSRKKRNVMRGGIRISSNYCYKAILKVQFNVIILRGCGGGGGVQ